MKNRFFGALALALALLAGCGGGGGGSTAPAATVQNKAPVVSLALAGQLTATPGTGDAATFTGADVKFDAGGSTDPDGDALAYSWTLARPGTSTATVKGSGASVTVTPDVAGTYVMTVRVTDSKGAFTDKVANLVVAANAAPVTSVAITASYSATATTKPAQTVTVGASILLDGNGSVDADSDPVTTTWELVTRPAGSTAALVVSGKTARLNTDLAGNYAVRARGTDPSGAYSETVYPFVAVGTAPQVVVVTSVDNGPVDTGGNLVYGTIGYVMSLSTAADPYTTYAWTLVSHPAGSTGALSATTGAFAQITPDVLGYYVVKVVATASSGVAASYTTTIWVQNRSPNAAIVSNATPIALPSGPTLRLPVNTTVTLRGTGSTDADGDVLTYLWALDAKPAGSATTLSAPDQSTVQLTTDKPGSYVVSLRVTDTHGAYSVQTITVASGNAAPVAVVGASRVSTFAGTAANLDASYSFDDDGDTLTYAWALDARPANSAATISATISPTTAQLPFTPDVAGTYVASVTVSDGKTSSVAYVTVVALSGSVTSTRLPFTPLVARYSRGLDKFVAVSTGPDLLNIVDPFTGTLRQVPLPGPVKEMTLSPDGKLAVALHEGSISVVDLQNTALLHSSATNGTQTAAIILNNGLVYLTGQSTYVSSAMPINVINGLTGGDLSSTLGQANTYMSLYNTSTGIYSPVNHKAFISSPSYSSYVYSFGIDTVTNAASTVTSTYYGDSVPSPLFLSGKEDILFSSNGNFFRSDTLAYAGKLGMSYLETIASLSQSSAADEAIAMTSTQGNVYTPATGYNRLYLASYHRYTGALYYAAPDIALPQIGGLQSYGVGIYHSANGNHIALVQTGSQSNVDTNLKFFLLAR